MVEKKELYESDEIDDHFFVTLNRKVWLKELKRIEDLETKVSIITEIIQPEDFKLHFNFREQIASLKHDNKILSDQNLRSINFEEVLQEMILDDPMNDKMNYYLEKLDSKTEKMTDDEIMLFNEELMAKIHKRKIQPLEVLGGEKDEPIRHVYQTNKGDFLTDSELPEVETLGDIFKRGCFNCEYLSKGLFCDKKDGESYKEFIYTTFKTGICNNHKKASGGDIKFSEDPSGIWVKGKFYPDSDKFPEDEKLPELKCPSCSGILKYEEDGRWFICTNINCKECFAETDYRLKASGGEKSVCEGSDTLEVNKDGSPINSKLPEPNPKYKGWNHSNKYNLGVLKAKIERALNCENHDPVMPMCINLNCGICGDEKPKAEPEKNEFKNIIIIQAMINHEHLLVKQHKKDIQKLIEVFVKKLRYAHNIVINTTNIEKKEEYLGNFLGNLIIEYGGSLNE